MAEHEHHADPVAHHAAGAAKATGLKKKIGPLPLWAWIVIVGGTIAVVVFTRKSSSSTSPSGNTVDPNNPLGLTYSQEQSDLQQGIDPNTGESYASEQSAADAAQGAGGVSGGAGAPATGSGDDTDSLNAIDGDLQTLQTEISSLPVNDGQTPEQTFASEIGDLGDGITAIKALEATLAPTPVTTAAAATKPGTSKPAAGKPATPSVASEKAKGVSAKPTVVKRPAPKPAAPAPKSSAKVVIKAAPAKKVTVSGKKKK